MLSYEVTFITGLYDLSGNKEKANEYAEVHRSMKAKIDKGEHWQQYIYTCSMMCL